MIVSKAGCVVGKKALAVFMAALLCMPATGFEYAAFADDEASSQAAVEQTQEESRDASGAADSAAESAEAASEAGDESVPEQAGDAAAEEAARPIMDESPLAGIANEDLGTPADVQLVVSDAPTTGAGDATMYIVRKGQEKPPTVTLPVTLDIREDESIGNLKNPVTLTANIPYLYYDEQGNVQQTLSESEWAQKDPDNLRMRLAAKPVPDKKWSIYRLNEASGAFEEIKNDSEELANGLSGTIQFRYVGNEGHMRLGSDYGTPQFKVEFQGPVPEAATATVGAGMHVGVKTDADGEHYGDFTIEPGTNEGGSIRKATFVNTNLEWESSITPISSNALWDRINYMVYEVRVKNVSKTTEASIHHAAFSISTKANGQSNVIRQEDIAAFKRLPDGSIVANDDPYGTSATLAGVPGEGGVLIYDVTNLTDEQRAAIDLDRFSNVGDFGLTAIDYKSLQAGQVDIDLAHDAAAANGHLVSKGEEGTPDYNPDNYDETVLYVAMPFTTNFQPIENEGEKQYPPINMENIPTVYFGVNGANSWSKAKETVSRAFAYPKIEFLQTKNALATDGTPQKEANGSLGYLSHYTITDIRSQGNMPLFGMESASKGFGPVMVDTLPDGFDLSSLDIVLDKQDVPELPQNDVDDWFCTDAEGSYIQFETEAADGEKKWISLGAPVYQGETPDGKLMWKLGSDGDGGGSLSEQLEASSDVFTGSVRFIFKDAIPAGRTMPGFIRVNGVMSDPYDAYQNNVTSTYAQKQWNPPTSESEGHYTYNERTSTAQATLVPEEVAPSLQSYAYTSRNDGSTDQGPSVIAPLGSESSGYRFTLGNGSSSKMAPARMSVTGFDFTSPSKGENYGFVTTKIVLSGDLMTQARGVSVVLHRVDGSDIAISSDQLATIAPDASGSIALARDEWFDDAYLTGFDVLMESFDPSSQHPNARPFVDVFGAPTRVDSFTAHGVFSTDYEAPFAAEQRQAESDAELVVERPSATVHAHASYVDVPEAVKPHTASSDGDQAQISVPYDRDFALWADIGNDSESMLDDVDITFDVPLTMEKGIPGRNGTADAWTGFHVTGMVLSARFLAAFPEKGELHFYDADAPNAPALVLTPTADGSGLEGGGSIYLSDDKGDIRIPEKALSDAGIENVSKAVLHSWKGMPSGTQADGTTVLLEGFADAAFDTTRTMNVEAVNHFGGVRPQGGAISVPFAMLAVAPAEDPWSASTVDSALFYMSKMSFDVSARAGFVEEGDAARFSQLAATSEHDHRLDGDVDKTLELGYKAMGSYLVDFRQFTNAWNERPDATSDHWDTQDMGEKKDIPYATRLSAKTYNTAAELTLTQNLPKDYFDAYYIKVHPDAVDNLKSIEVFYSDGTSWKSDASSWADTDNAVETDANGTPFFRVNLLKPAQSTDAGAATFEPDFSDDKAFYHRDALSDYAQDDFVNGVYGTPVAERIVYTLDINENQYADDARTQAAGPDFGTEYRATDAANAAIEVAGRFYKEDDRSEDAAKQTVQASLSIGGEQGDGRHIRAAANRFTAAKQGSTAEYSSWSYRDYASYYTNDRNDHIEGHISSHADVDIIFDGNFVLKGTKGVLEYGADGDEHAVMGGDYRFDVSFARSHVTLKSGYNHPSVYAYNGIDDRSPDNWTGNVSFADKVVLTDKLPVCGPEQTHGYYGFLTTGMELLAGDAGILDHLESITFETQTAVSNQTALAAAAGFDAASMPLAGATRTLTFTKDQLSAYTDAAGNVFIEFDVPGEDPAPETAAPGVNALHIALGQNEFVKNYRIELSAYTGDGDYAAETGKTYEAQRSGTIDDRDLYVFGRPYVYKGQTTSDEDDAMNTVTAHGYRSAHPDKPVASTAIHTDGYRFTPSDQAYYLGYLIPFSAGYRITGTDGSTADRSAFDYQVDNNTPTVVDHEVYFWNKKDENAGDRRSARITRATLKTEEYHNTGDGTWFRMQHVYLPAEFVDIKGNAAYGNWFKVDSVTLDAQGKSLVYGLQDLADKGLLKPGGNGEYVLDVEGALRLDPSVLETYAMTSKTNTLDSLRGTSEDTQYTKAYVDSIALDFKAAHPSYDDDATTLDGGQYLAADRQKEGPAFRYDGVFVDRTSADFAADAAWNETSTPTFGKHANGYGQNEEVEQYLTASNIESIDPNHAAYHDDAGVVRENRVFMSNLRSQMNVSYDRGKTVELNGSEQEVFAYDLGDMDDPAPAEEQDVPAPEGGSDGASDGALPDSKVDTDAPAFDESHGETLESGADAFEDAAAGGSGDSAADEPAAEAPVDPHSNSMSDPSSVAPYAGKGNNIANGALFAGDYVEYTLGIGSAQSYGGKQLPLQKVDARFAVTEAQRIVGWEIIENTTGVPNESITARLVEEGDADKDGVPNSSIACDPARNYSRIDAQTGEPAVGGEESFGYNRNLVLSVGSAGTEIPYGTSLTIRVITQMTDKAAGHDGAVYDASDNAAWNGTADDPAYAGKAYQARFVATCAPMHGYAQYDVGDSGTDAVYATFDDGGSIAGQSATMVAHSRGNAAIVEPSETDGRFGAISYASNVFHKHEYDEGRGVIEIEGAFTEPSLTDPDHYLQDNDGSPAQLTVSNITNETSHAGSITVTTSFMKTVEDKTTGQGVEYRSFELTESPKTAASRTEVLQENGVDVDVRYPADMPTNHERLPILVEYFDESLPDGGAWVSEADLAARYAAPSEPEADGQNGEDGADAQAAVLQADAADEEGEKNASDAEPAAGEHVNIFKNVTQVRWTYFDVPATSDGVAPYAFEDVALVGVGRFSDARPSTGNIEQDDCFGGVKVDWGFVHYHHEKNILDFVTAPAVLETPDFEEGLDDGMAVDPHDGIDPDMGFDPDAGVDDGIAVAAAESSFDGDMMVDPGAGVDPGMGFDPDAGIDDGMMVDPGAQPEGAAEDPRVEHGTTLTKASEYAEAPLNVWRRVPVMQFQTQTFQTEGQARAPYNPDALQKTAYIPGETFYYKDSLVNMPRGTNSSAPDLEGELYNPAIYERIPSSYLEMTGADPSSLTSDMLHISWVDRDGNEVLAERTAGASLTVEKVDAASGAAPDYGGSMTYAKSKARAADFRLEAGKPFDDLDPRAQGVSNEATFDLYRIAYERADGTPVRMEIGDRIEVSFAVKAKTDGLARVSLDQDRDLATDTDRAPAFFPRVGEYYSEFRYSSEHNVNGLGSDFGISGSDDVREVGTASKLMDMDALMHEAAFSGDKPAQSDRWEAFDASYTYIPGSSVNGEMDETEGESGNNDVFLDADMKTERAAQKTRYTPRVSDGDDFMDALPADTWLLTPNEDQEGDLKQETENLKQDGEYNRDFHEFVTNPRTTLEGNGGIVTPLVWSQTRLHLRSAWLASASSLEPGDTQSYKEERAYRSGGNSDIVRDPHEAYIQSDEGTDGEYDNVYDAKGIVFNRYDSMLQYNQDFTTRLQALNYGDRTLDGVEMVYVMPRGVEPAFAEGTDLSAIVEGGALPASVLDVKARVLEKKGWNGDYTKDAALTDVFVDIPADAYTVEVLQTPYGDYRGYDAPSDSQDPASYYVGNVLADGTQDYSAAPSDNAVYESKKAESADGESAGYTESSQPWVLKITVKHDLGKWFGRAVDSTEADASDADAYVDGGYKIDVEIPSHVFANNENGAWYDRLLVAPWDDESSGKASPASSYYHVLDIDHFEGRNADSSEHDLQVLGMDYQWAIKAFSDWGYPNTRGRWDLSYGSPNMPFSGGQTVQNHSVAVTPDAPLGKAVEDDFAAAGVALFAADKGGTRIWAATGGTAKQRQPLVRVWNTVGDDGVTGDADAYYLNTEMERVQLNMHVENRYWLDTLGKDYSNYSKSVYPRNVHNYATDGGSMGDLTLPVVTSVIPEGIAVVSRDGKPYPTDGKEYPLAAEDWSVSTATADDYRADKSALSGNDAEYQKLFDAFVSYQTFAASDGSGEPVSRYVVRFVAKADDTDGAQGAIVNGNAEARIPSGGMSTFKVNLCTVAPPRFDAQHAETMRSYENVSTYVSSKMGGYRFLTDDDIKAVESGGGNPYTVGGPGVSLNYASTDYRLDAYQAKDKNGVVFGLIPADAIDDGQDTVLKAPTNTLPGFQYGYTEEDASDGASVEDYAFRAPLPLADLAVSSHGADATLLHALDADADGVCADAFARKETGVPDERADAGVFSTLKLRAAQPRLVASHAVEFDPETDRFATARPAAGDGVFYEGEDAAAGEYIDRTGATAPQQDAPDFGEPLQYGDTPWYSVKVENKPASEDDRAHKGALNHAQLRFVVDLPRNVTFYDETALTDRNYFESESFYFEYLTPDMQEPRVITPKQLHDEGWFVHIEKAPDWGADDFTDPDYAKPDAGDPNQTPPASDTSKPKDHDGETFIIDIAAPSDETDDEFARYDSLIDAARSGVHIDGYFGSGYALTLKMKTRIDNTVGEEDASPLGQETTAADLDRAFKQQAVEEARAYMGIEGADGSWIKVDGSWDEAWDHRFVASDGSVKVETKPALDRNEHGDPPTIFDESFAAQDDETFDFVELAEDGAATPTAAEVDHDGDGDLSDRYAFAAAGRFAVAYPDATARIDTLELRSLVGNPDLGADVADDPYINGEYGVLLDQATNDGGAVNSFMVDWQIPLRGTLKGLSGDAPNEGKLMRHNFKSIDVGVWEIAGADGVAQGIDASDGGVSAEEATYLKEIEDHLRVYVLARVVPEDTAADNGAYQGDAAYTLPGMKADRDAQGEWVMLGSRDGYAVSDKVNYTIDEAEIKQAVGEGNVIRQLRWVVKAQDIDAAARKQGKEALADDSFARIYPVPQGFRMAVDAVPDDAARPETLGSQEPDDIDPERENIGWEVQRDENGDPVYDAAGNLETVNGTSMPESVRAYAAGASISTTTDEQVSPMHMNHFATASPRYDDTKFASTERARAGLYRNPEQPHLAIDMDQQYFYGSPKEGYAWQKNFAIDTGLSRMMKYRLKLTNLSTEALGALGIDDKADTATRPDLSIMFPFIEDMPTEPGKFFYKTWSDVENNPESPLNDGYATYPGVDDDGNEVYASSLDNAAVSWTYHVVDETGKTVGIDYEKFMPNPALGADIAQKDQLGPNLLQNRKYMAWNFSGTLEPGQTLVLDVMVPIREGSSSSTSSSLLNCIGYVHKDGRFKPYVPERQEGNKLIGWIIDTRDANLDNDINQTMLDIELASLSFAENAKLQQSKVSSSDLADYYDWKNGGAVPVPEGTSYEYEARLKNGYVENDSTGQYVRSVLYDVLPYEGDYKVLPESQDPFDPIPRDSQWNGWPVSFDDMALRIHTPSDGVNGESYRVLDDKESSVYVAPFFYDGSGVLRAGTAADLPDTGSLTDGEARQLWISERYNDPAKLKAEGFVPLSEMKAYVAAHPDQEESLLKGVRAVWAQANGAVEPHPHERLDLVCTMRAPLNVEMHVGDASADAEAPSDDVADVVQWNTFLMKTGDETDASKSVFIEENGKAGAYVNAPSGRGYIGDYVWHDADWDGLADDTVNGAEDYRASANGRRLLAGADPETGERFESGAKLKDLDYDGAADDPGIDGVKVELLNEHGRPVNRDGQAVKFVEGVGQDHEGLWVQCDPKTGDPLLNDLGSPIVATAGGPYAYVTERDYYGNSGYFAFSNLAPTGTVQSPGAPAVPKYRLRYTFPEECRNYAPTKFETGSGLDAGEPVGLSVKRETADDGSSTLTVTTEAFEVKAVDEAGAAAYDAAAMSYDVGVSMPVRYGGLAWRDDVLEGGAAEASPIDGWLDEQRPDGSEPEARLANMRVSVHEYDPEADEVAEDAALDADGNPAVADTAADGAFSFLMPTDRSYVVKAQNLNEGEADRYLKPTPYLHANSPLTNEKDNDIAALHGGFATSPFESAPLLDKPADEGGKPVYAVPGDRASGYAPRDSIALGFVDSAKGFVGDTVFEDANRDGVKQLDEGGVAGMEVTLEQYWWDEDANGGEGAWELDPDEPVRTAETTDAGVYAFEVRTTYVDDAKAPHLRGFKVRIDNDDLTAHGAAAGHAWVVTHRGVGGDDEVDSDIDRAYADAGVSADAPHDAKVRTRYLTDECIVVADRADDGTPDNAKIEGPDGILYDASVGLSDLTWDAGLAAVPKSTLAGWVFDDGAMKDGAPADEPYDGLNKALVHKGIPNQEVRLTQWYLKPAEDGKSAAWIQNYEFGQDDFTKYYDNGITTRDAASDGTGAVVAKTNLDGMYFFDRLPTAYTDPATGESYLASYRAALVDLEKGYLLTRYHAADFNEVDGVLDATTYDSDARARDYAGDKTAAEDSMFALHEREGFDAADPESTVRAGDRIVLADATDAAPQAGDALYPAENPEDQGAVYDPLAVRLDANGAARKGAGDVGQVAERDGSIEGLVWSDADGDGAQDEEDAFLEGAEGAADPGVDGVEVALDRYVAVDGAWTLDKEGIASTPTATSDGRAGVYRFDGVPAYDPATREVYAYRVRLADPAAVYAAHLASPMRACDDPSADSDLEASTGVLADTIDAGEYIVLLEKADPDTPQTNRAAAPAASRVGDGSAADSAYEPVVYDLAQVVDHAGNDAGLIDPPDAEVAGALFVDSDGDALLGAGSDKPLAGKEVTLRAWYLDEAAGVWKRVEALDMKATTGDDGSYSFDAPVSSWLGDDIAGAGAAGRCLMGYTLALSGADADAGVRGMVPVEREAGAPATDAASSKAVHKEGSPDDYGIAWKDATSLSGKTVRDGRLVLAAPYDGAEAVNASNVLAENDALMHEAASSWEGFDITAGVSEKRMHGGFVAETKGSVEGLVWHDADGDGVQDGPGAREPGLFGRTVRLSQYYLDDAGAWVENTAFAQRTATTGADGRYGFADLPASVSFDEGGTPLAPDADAATDVRRLAAYRVDIDVPEGEAATRLWAGDDVSKDSDAVVLDARHASLRESYASKTAGEQRRDGYAIVAAADENGAASYDGISYDVLHASKEAVRAGDAGMVEARESASIEGAVWRDADGDGLQNEFVEWAAASASGGSAADPGIDGVEVVLDRYIVEGGAWVLEAEDFARATTAAGTDASLGVEHAGVYRFDGLAAWSFDQDTGTYVPYGYRVRLADPAALDGVPSPVRVGTDASIDSDLHEKGMLVDEATGERLVLMERAVSGAPGCVEVPMPEGGVASYHPLLLRDAADVDAGVAERGGAGGGDVEAETASIEGVAWRDADKDGVRDAQEEPLAGVEVELSRYRWVPDDVREDAAWQFDAAFAAEAERTAVTDAEGRYVFEGLPATAVSAAGGASGAVVYGYRVNVTAFDDALAPTAVDRGDDPSRDSDLDASTTRLVPDDARGGLTVLAGDAEGAAAAAAGPDGLYAADAACDRAGDDAGFIEPASASVEGRTWVDDDGDGAQDAFERALPGLPLTLERRPLAPAELAEGFGELHGDGAPGSGLDAAGEPLAAGEPARPYASGSASVWEQAGSAESGIDGSYRFEGLPAFDEDGVPYAYRVTVELPEGASLVPVGALGVPDDLDNELGELPGEAPRAGTAPLTAALVAEGASAYGQAYRYDEAARWARELGNPVDLGMRFEPAQEEPAAPGEGKPTLPAWPFPTTGDPLGVLLAVLTTVAVATAALFAAARRRARERRPRD